MTTSPPKTLQRRSAGNLVLALGGLGVLFGVVGLLFLNLYMIRGPLKGPDGLVSGPSLIGELSFAPGAVLVFCYLQIMNSVSRQARLDGSDPVAAMKARLSRWPVIALAVFAVLAYLAGVSAYWVATPRGVDEHLAAMRGRVSHPWSDLTQRSIGCHPGKRGYRYVKFVVDFGDGFTVDLAATQQNEVRRTFARLSELTAGAKVSLFLSNYQLCPPEVAAVVARW